MTTKRTENKLAVFWFLLALVILFVIAALSFFNTRKLMATNAQVAHTYEVILQLERTFSIVTDAEAGQRDYLLTGQEERRAAYTAAVGQVSSSLKRLKEITTDSTLQQERIARLESQIAIRLAALDEGAKKRGNEGLEGALQTVKTGKGMQAMTEVRSLIEEMERTEKGLLAAREAEARAGNTRTLATFSVGLGLSCGLLLLVFSILTDEIAERQRAEKALTEQAQELATSEQVLRERTALQQLVLASIGDGVCVSDEKGEFLVFNPAAEEILKGGPSTGGIDEWTDAYGLFLPDTVTRYPAQDLPLARAMRGESVDAIELFMRHVKAPDGAWLTVNARPIRNEAGISRGGVAVFSDITERKRFERGLQERTIELGDANAQLAAANNELEAFSYSTSHDLRAPLRHVAGYAEMLQKSASSNLDEKGRRYVAIIVESAQRMGMLIDHLLAFSRLGRADLKKETIDLNQLVAETIRELNEGSDRRVFWEVAPLPVVDADATLLKLVVTNLLSNAFKYTRNRVSAEIEVGYEDQGTESVIFVRDNGAGFDMRYADKLFGVFQRLHRADEFEGTGIGLASVRRIIARHGGRTWAEGVVDGGAAFYFSLPVANASTAVPVTVLPILSEAGHLKAGEVNA